jgi:hypothetical protein
MERALTDIPLAPAPAAARGPAGRAAIGRLGLALVAAAGVVAALSAMSDVTVGEGRVFPLVTYTLDGTVVALGVVMALVAAAAAVLPWRMTWARLVGIGLGTLFAGFCALLVIGATASDRYARGVRPDLELGGALLVIAFWVAVAGIALALVGVDDPSAPPAGAPAAPGAQPRTAPAAITSLVLGITGVIFFVTTSLATAFGLIGLGQIGRSGGRLGGRGLAVAGLVLGLVGFVVWTLGLGIGMLIAEP